MSKYSTISKFCPRCGEEFTTYVNAHKIFCNSCTLEERLLKHQKLDKTYTCEVCGKSFDTDFRRSRWQIDPPRFCSRSCANKKSNFSINYSKIKIANCIRCGKEVEIKLTASKKSVICEDCKNKEKEERLKNKEHSQKIKQICPFCGREITKTQLKSHERACTLNPDSFHKHHTRKRKDCREGYIYKVTNIINNKQYIGKHVGKPENSKNYLGSGIAIRRAVDKYGKENFVKEILEYTPDGDLNELEEKYIKKYHTNIVGYNMTSGGDG